MTCAAPKASALLLAALVAGVYRPQNGVLTEIQGSGGVSPADATEAARAAEASYAQAWFKTITAETFG
jgi:sulfide dehydrogenase [flavocytochrome c] flavoprotein subunit